MKKGILKWVPKSFVSASMYSDVFVPFVDIAETSVKHYKDRYSQLEKDYKNRRYNRDPLFTAEFLAADCTKVLNYVDLEFCI